MKSRKPNRPPDPVVEARTRGQFVANAVPDGEHRRRSRRKQQARAPPDDDDDDHHDGAFSIRSSTPFQRASFTSLERWGLARRS